jgi:hypothetical protein
MVGGPQQNSRAHQNLVAASLTSGLITAQDGNHPTSEELQAHPIPHDEPMAN